MSIDGHQKREALLDELESIRQLLGDDTASTDYRHSTHGSDSRIPLLIPDDSIPTLGPELHHHDATAAQHQRDRKAARALQTTKKTFSSQAFLASPRDREKLVDDIVRNALPRLESILRELVQEALLQEKLRGGRR